MLFQDRNEAARLLAQVLQHYRGQQPLVLAIPRGAVPMGKILADELGGQLDVVMVRKIGAPAQREFALAAVDEAGQIYPNPNLGTDALHARYIHEEAQRQLATMRSRRAMYTPGQEPIDPADRVVIVVDDGLATGSTMIAALKALRTRQPARLVCAVPVAPHDTLLRIRALADEVVCLQTPDNFQAIGQFYRNFEQVEDDVVIATLEIARRHALLQVNADSASLAQSGEVTIDLPQLQLEGWLHPGDGQRLVLFAHGSGSSRHSPRNRYVAQVLNQAGIGTLLFDMLTRWEDEDGEMRFDIGLLTGRLLAVTRWLSQQHSRRLSLGYFGASTGAAAALRAAADPANRIDALVARGGRPDLAGVALLRRVTCPTLLLVGSLDQPTLELNRQAMAQMSAPTKLLQINGATHLFEEPGTLEQVAANACMWFERYLGAGQI